MPLLPLLISHLKNFNFFKNPYDEAVWIADKIEALRGEGLDFTDQAVLFRSAYLSIAFQAELNKRGIPYQIFGGLKFYETAHVKDIISHLKVVMNPKDEIAWHRILTLIDGIGPKTADSLTEDYRKAKTTAESATPL